MSVPQTSLTSPGDRDNKHLFNFNKEPLTDEQVDTAKKELVNKDHIEMYPAQERAFSDPSIPDQDYGLVSFVPSVNAKPDEDGIYGMVKLRGVYNTLEKCDQRSEFLIKNVDSVHKIYIAGMGKPFPITESSKFSKEINKVKIQEKMTEDIKSQKSREETELEEMRQREKEIMNENNDDKVYDSESEDHYIMSKVKKAQLTWTYINTMKKLKDMKREILNARDEIDRLDSSKPDYNKSYLDRYNDSLKRVNLKQEKDSFVMYLEDDGEEELGF